MKADNRVHDDNASDLSSQSQSDIKILLVERNPVDAAVAQKILELMNYQNTVIAASNSEAIKLFSASRYGMVIIGIGLPYANEVELCAQIRSLRPDEYIPVLAYADFGQKIELESLVERFDDFLFKFTGFDDFQRVIQRCAPLSGDTS